MSHTYSMWSLITSLPKYFYLKNYKFCKIITLKERVSAHVDVICCTVYTSISESESAGTFTVFVFQIFFEGIVLTEILGELKENTAYLRWNDLFFHMFLE